jgi:energy-coupling factor transporter ATP-binding protein EcfA2
MIDENLRSCKLKEIYIQNLFYKYNYNIPLNDERITIIHGLNSSGKTTIFNILNSFFKQNFRQLFFIPFDFFELIFENGVSICVYSNRFQFEKKCINDKTYFDFLNREFFEDAIYEELKNKESNLTLKRSRRYGDYDHFRNKLRDRDKLFELIFEIKYSHQKNITVFEYTVPSEVNRLHESTWKEIEPSKSKFKGAFKNKVIEYLNHYSGEFFPRNIIPNPHIKFIGKGFVSEDVEEITLRIEEITEYLNYFENGESGDPDPQRIVDLYKLKKQQELITKEKENKPKFSPSSIGDLFFHMLGFEREVHFIESQRLYKIHLNDYATQQLKNDSQHLKELITQANEISGTESRKSDKEYLKNFVCALNIIDDDNETSNDVSNDLIEKMRFVYRIEAYCEKVFGFYESQHELIIDNYNEMFKKLKINEKREVTTADAEGLLEGLGIYCNKEHEGKRLRWEEPEIRLALDIYLDGRINALKPIHLLGQKCATLHAIVYEKFKNKMVNFTQEDGMMFYDLELTEKQGVHNSIYGKEHQYAYHLTPEQLSSGEKHLLIIIYNILFRIQDNSLILIDEPEISLHISWQIKFIEILKKILELEDKKNVQILIATHSPQIINGRWDLTVGLGALE